MSFRDVRALTEHLRSLGYPSVISLESFRTPNFDLVADLLAWLVKSYDPHADIPLTIGSEDERVAFITAVAEFVATRAQVKLNPRKLYMADGTAVRELLKLVDLFNSANDALAADSDPADAALVKVGGGFMYHHGTGAGGGSADGRNRKPAASGGGGGMIGTSTPVSSAVVGDLSTKSATIRAARDLASDLTNRGATLYDMLATEAQSRAARSAALSKAIDLPSLRTAAQAALAAAQTEVTNLAQTVASMTTDATALAAKIEKKNTELERRNKRLKSMQGVRPAYMDEFERVEGELKGVYEKYVQAIRNLAWLESLVEESLRVEMDESEEAEMSLKRLQQRMKQEELNMLRGDVDGLLGAGGDTSDMMYQGDDDDDVEAADEDDDEDVGSEDSFARDEDGDDDFGANSTGIDREFDASEELGANAPKSAMLRDDEFMDALIMGRGSNVGKPGKSRRKATKRSKNPQGYGGLDSDLDGESDDNDLGQAAEDHAQLNERLSQILRDSDPPIRDRSGATRSKTSRNAQQNSSNLSMASRDQLGSNRLADSENEDDSEEGDEDPELDDDLVAGGQYVPKQQSRGNAKKSRQTGPAAAAIVDDDDDEALLSGIVDYGDDGAGDSDEDQAGGARMDESDNDF